MAKEARQDLWVVQMLYGGVVQAASYYLSEEDCWQAIKENKDSWVSRTDEVFPLCIPANPTFGDEKICQE